MITQVDTADSTGSALLAAVHSIRMLLEETRDTSPTSTDRSLIPIAIKHASLAIEAVVVDEDWERLWMIQSLGAVYVLTRHG
jgi:hypothetical protein